MMLCVILYLLALLFAADGAGRGGLLDLPGCGKVRQRAGAAVRLPQARARQLPRPVAATVGRF